MLADSTPSSPTRMTTEFPTSSSQPEGAPAGAKTSRDARMRREHRTDTEPRSAAVVVGKLAGAVVYLARPTTV